MKVALDAMGGDHAPRVTVEGALAAVDEFGSDLRVILVGPTERIREELSRCGREQDGRIEITHAPQVISSHEKAVRALRDKRDSSIARAVELHRTRKADAVVSAGHTGAQMAASYMMLGLIEGVRRPTIGGLFPAANGRFSILLDVGANTDCKPGHLLQFAIMGSVFQEIVGHAENPRVALLSIGEEKNKGNDLVFGTNYLLEHSGLNYVGHVEGSDLFTGKADVVVCDGFVGNVMLKFAESVGSIILNRFSRAAQEGASAGAAVQQLQKEFDYSEVGGVPLLGVNGVSIICHGRSSVKAIKNAIREAMVLSKGDLPAALARGMARYDVGMFIRGVARWKGFHEGRGEFEIDKDQND
jgi:glycerol-3-phosphate acyltransferase PlsX